MAYRDDLEAAQIRIEKLEAQLAELEAIAWRKRGRTAPPWGWLAVCGAAVLALVTGGAMQVIYAQELDVQRHVEILERELDVAQADAAEAREDSRVAFEAIAQTVERDQREIIRSEKVIDMALEGAPKAFSDPFRNYVEKDTGTLMVVSDRKANVVVDGTSVHTPSPATIRLKSGRHWISVVSGEDVKREIVGINAGMQTKLVVHFGEAR